MKYKLDAIANNKTSLVKEYETRYNILAEMQSDLDKWSITSLKDFETKYGRTVTDKFGRKHFSRLPSDLIKEWDKLIDVEKNIKTLETDINKLKNEAKLKLDELEKKAKLDPKQKTKFQAEAKKIVAEYNKKIGEAEQKIGTSLSKVTISELAELEKRSPLVKWIVKINDGLDKFAEKTKLGKFMIWFSVLGLVGKWVGGETSWGQVGLEAADLATGMVPFAGGAYDVWTSITGKGIAGELSTTDRWIRGATWAVSVVLDVAWLFTFGIGNGASAGLKAAVRWWTKMTKVAKWVKVAAETLNTGMKLATYGVLGITLVSQTVPMLTSLYETVDKKVTADIPVN